VYKLKYSAKYSMVAGSKGNKTSIIFDKIDFKEYYKQNFPKIFNARERRMY